MIPKSVYYVALLIVLASALYVGARPTAVSMITPKEAVPDTRVPMISPEYTDLPGIPVRGKLTLRVPPVYQGMTLVVCNITDGVMYTIDDQLVLECQEGEVSEGITSNEVEISLYSGSYFVDVKEKRDDAFFPFRVNVHKGKRATVAL